MVNKEKCLKIVIEQIANMLSNNKEELGGIGESFEGWCEDGEVFYNLTETDIPKEHRITEEEEKQCEEYMKRLAPTIDNMTMELSAVYEDIEKEN